MSKMIEHIVIVGSGLPLAMTSAIIAKTLKTFNIKVTVLALKQNNDSSQAEVCGPEFSALCGILGLDEREIIRQCQGTFRLGNHYQTSQHDWFVPFAHLGLNAEQDDFELGLFQYLNGIGGASLQHWSIAASAAMAGKFAIAGKDRPELRLALDYGVQLDRQSYQGVIEKYALQQNVNWLELPENGIKVKRNLTGDIESIMLGEQQFFADFWLDATSTGLLSVDMGSAEPLDFAISHKCEWTTAQVDLTQPCSKMTKLAEGWLKTITLRDKTVYQFFVDSKQVDLAQTEQTLRAMELGFEQTQWQTLNCQVQPEPWRGNCLRLGANSLQLGTLVFSELQILQAAVVQFIDLFPDLPIGKHNRRHYNKLWHRFVQDAVDFTVAHFVTPNEELVALPASLKERIQVFARLGRIGVLHSDAVTESQWQHLLFGLGYRPQLPCVVLSAMGPQNLEHAIKKVQGTISQLVKGMPSHQQYLERFYPTANNH